MRAHITGLLLASALLTAGPALAGNLANFSEALARLSDMTMAADQAYDSLQDAMTNGSDYGRFEQSWRDSERRLEQQRVQTMARIAKVSEATILKLRKEGKGWATIAQKYGVNPPDFGFGLSPYDTERDGWKGTPPGLAKKGGMPPGLAKQGGMPPGQAKKQGDPNQGKHKN